MSNGMASQDIVGIFYGEVCPGLPLTLDIAVPCKGPRIGELGELGSDQVNYLILLYKDLAKGRFQALECGF